MFEVISPVVSKPIIFPEISVTAVTELLDIFLVVFSDIFGDVLSK